MSYDLQVLAEPKNRDALLLAEVAAWLHNIGKFSEEFVYSQFAAAGNPSYADYKDFKYQHVVGIVADIYTDPTVSLPRDAQNRLKQMLGTWDVDKTLGFLLSSHADFVRWLRHTTFRLPKPLDDREYSLGDLIEFQDKKWYDGTSPLILQLYPSGSKATALLEASHHAGSGVEKEDSKDGDQLDKPLYRSTAFGYESALDLGEWQNLRNRLIATIQDNQYSKQSLRPILSSALADTRRPINEVTLWDISAAVTAFYKAAAAKVVIEQQWTERDDLKWRILRVAINGIAFYGQVARLPDLQSRHDLINEVLDEVCKRLEKSYPIANEIYRDETGSAFLVPDLDGDDKDGAMLKSLVATVIRDAFDASSVAGEITPLITVSQPDKQGLKLADELKKQTPEPQANPDSVKKWWLSQSADVCPVCGLRPQGPGKKAHERKVCDVCEERRADRARDWASHLTTTIWTDEAADVNGRLALIVGQFDLSEWLNGKMVQTLTVTEPQNGQAVLKNPSFARLRRVWETTRTFWQSALSEPDADGKPTISPVTTRLGIIPQDRERLNLGKFHTYELVVNGVRVGVVWDAEKHRFITCDNLAYLAKPEQLGKPLKEILGDAQTRRQSLTIEEPTGYGAKNKKWGEIAIEAVDLLPESYTPAIPILAEPRTFIALVPANRALEVVKAIKAKHEREMGKVRNRLPLTLGAVYFGRHTPLAAALEAGRRMLKRQVMSGQWSVISNPPVVNGTQVVTLNNGEREITMRVSTVMGDGKTPDVWYPYWRAENKPMDRQRWFIGLDGEHWVHVGELKKDDVVQFTPSTFDFEFLDTTARRFEVSYDDNGRRRGEDKRQRPYLLEQVEDIEAVWKLIKPKKQADKEPALSTTQIKALEALIQAKRAEWLKQPNGQDSNAQHAFRQFCRDALATAGWRGKPWTKFSDDEKQLLERAAVSSLLADALELHWTIAKEGDEKEE